MSTETKAITELGLLFGNSWQIIRNRHYFETWDSTAVSSPVLLRSLWSGPAPTTPQKMSLRCNPQRPFASNLTGAFAWYTASDGVAGSLHIPARVFRTEDFDTWLVVLVIHTSVLSS
jgi:hypothetical protein